MDWLDESSNCADHRYPNLTCNCSNWESDSTWVREIHDRSRFLTQNSKLADGTSSHNFKKADSVV